MEKQTDIQCKSPEPSLHKNSDRRSIIETIREQHGLICEKLLPEIDMHFSLVLDATDQNAGLTLVVFADEFATVAQWIRDHVYIEETLVLPLLSSGNFSHKHPMQEFIQKHDAFEEKIIDVLTDIQMNLSVLQELMQYRILILKLEKLVAVLEKHAELEAYLFSASEQ